MYLENLTTRSFEIYLNRHIANQLPRWTSSFPTVKYTFTKAQIGIMAVAIHDTFVIDQRQIIDKKALEQAMLNVSSTCLHHLESQPFEWIMSLKPKYAAQFVNGIFRAANTASGKMVVIHLERDLISRLRALSSAIAFAKKSKAWLRVIWQKDEHMPKAMKDVIDLQTSGLHDVWNFFSEVELDLALYDVHDCINKMNTCRVVNVCDKHVYIRSNGFFNSSVSTWKVQSQSAFQTLVQLAQPTLQWDKLVLAG